MIEVWTCNCGGAEPMARRFLRDAGVADYMSVPLYQGQKAEKRASEIEPSLIEFMHHRTGFVIVVGHDHEELMWENIGNNDIPARVRAELIVSRFA